MAEFYSSLWLSPWFIDWLKLWIYVLHLLHSFIYWRARGWLLMSWLLQILPLTLLHVSFQISIFGFPGHIPRSGIAGSYIAVLFLPFWGTSILFPKVAALVCFSHQQCMRVSFLRILVSSFHLWLLMIVFAVRRGRKRMSFPLSWEQRWWREQWAGLHIPSVFTLTAPNSVYL